MTSSPIDPMFGLGDCPPAALLWAYRGWRWGIVEGLRQAADAEGQASAAVAAGARPILRARRFLDVVAGREPDFLPCAAKCERCSRCIASLAYWARGGRPYLGVEREAEHHRGVA